MLKRWCGNIYSTSERNCQTFNETGEKQFWPPFWRAYFCPPKWRPNINEYKSSYFVEKSKCHKISPLNAFPLTNFGRKIIFTCFVNFGISKIPTHFLTKGSIVFMSSWCKWPISTNLGRMFHRFFSHNFVYSF